MKKNKLFFSIKYKIFLLLFIPLLIFSIIIILVSYYQDRYKLLNNYYLQRDNTENNLMKTIKLIDESYKILEQKSGVQIYEGFKIINQYNDMNKTNINLYLEKLSNHIKDWFEVNIINVYGVITYSSTPENVNFDLKKYPDYYKKYIQLMNKKDIVLDRVSSDLKTKETKISGYLYCPDIEHVIEIKLKSKELNQFSDYIKKLPEELKLFNEHLYIVEIFDIYGYNEDKSRDISDIVYKIKDEEYYEIYNKKKGIIKRYIYCYLENENKFYLSESSKILEVVYNIKPIIRQLNNLLFFYISSSLIFLLILTVLIIILANTITKPLLKIENIVKKYSNRDFSERLKITGNDEIANLAEGVNAMAGAIQLYTENLEQLVEARNQELSLEKEKSERLLLNILPHSIAERLKKNPENIIADKFDDVSILFADIVGFTKLSDKFSPDVIVSVLNDIFSHFDKLVEKYKLEKIKTIGDSYMVAGNIPEKNEGHITSICNLALEMIDFVKLYKNDYNIKLDIRIGINSGSVIAGVIGLKKFVYDIWGDAVNIASRMESHGIVGKIQISEVIYQRIKNDFNCEERGELEIKGKGIMKTYIINSYKYKS